MATIFEKFCNERKAYINPEDTTKPIPGFPKACVTTFSANVLEDFISDQNAAVIAKLYSANGELPVYEISYKGEKVGLFLSRVGGPACAVGLEEVIALGAKRIVQFGNCGVLQQEIVKNKIVIPSSAVRDEGTSYHYLPPSGEVSMDPDMIRLIEKCLQRFEIPYIVGKTWTTDGIYRETKSRIEERKREGCLTVEMECASSLAVAKFRNISFLPFLFGADNLDADTWEPNDLTDYGKAFGNKYMFIALECAIA